MGKGKNKNREKKKRQRTEKSRPPDQVEINSGRPVRLGLGLLGLGDFDNDFVGFGQA